MSAFARSALAILALGAMPSASAAATASLGDVEAVASPAGGFRNGEPSLSVATDGTVWMSWLEQPASTSRAEPPPASLQTSRLSGGRWLPALTVVRAKDLFVNWADPPVLAAVGRDAAWIAYPWKRPGVFAYDLRASYTPNAGAVWTKPVTLNRDGKAAQHGFVSLAPSEEGVTAVWLDGRKMGKPKGGQEPEGDMTLRAARLDVRGTLSREVEIDGRTCECCNTAAAAAAGGVLAAYRDRDPQETRDIAFSRLDDGHWAPPAPLHRDGWKVEGCPVNGPALDARGNRVAAAWFTGAGGRSQVLVAFSTDGGVHFGTPIPIVSGDPLGRVDVALTADGTALVSWLEALGQDALFRVQRIPAAGASPAPVTVARVSASRASGFPRMVVSGDRAYFAWVEARAGGGTSLKTASARIP